MRRFLQSSRSWAQQQQQQQQQHFCTATFEYPSLPNGELVQNNMLFVELLRLLRTPHTRKLLHLHAGHIRFCHLRTSVTTKWQGNPPRY